MKFPSLIVNPSGRIRLTNRHPIPPWTITDPAPTPVATATGNNHDARVVAGILALYACIVVPLALYLNLWIDESYTLFSTSRELSFIIPHCREFMLQPPAFFLMLWFWRRVSLSVWWARMFPVAVIGVTLWLAYRTARKWFPNFSSAWIVLPLVLNPWVLFAATELRSYCVVLLCATALLYFYWDAFVAEKTSRLAQVFYTLTAIVGMHTYYYLIFVLAGGGVALVLGRRWRAVRDYSIVTVVVAAAFVPQLLDVIEHAGVITADLKEMPDLARAMVYTSARIVSTEMDYFVFDQRFRVFWFGLFAVGVLWAAWFRWRDWTFRGLAIPIITVVITLGYLALTWKITAEESFRRHFLVALVPLHLSVVAVLANLGRSSGRALRITMIALAVFGVVSSGIRYAPLAKVGDYRRVAHFIESKEHPNEPIVLIASHAEIPFRYYYRGRNVVMPLPEHDPLKRYDIPGWALSGTEEVRDKLSAIRPQERIWVYADRPAHTAFYGVDLGYEYLEEVLAEDYTKLSEQDFYYAKVRQFEKK